MGAWGAARSQGVWESRMSGAQHVRGVGLEAKKELKF